MATVDFDDRGIVVACHSCGQKNRLVYERIGETVRCAKCKDALESPREPIEVRSTAEELRLRLGGNRAHRL